LICPDSVQGFVEIVVTSQGFGSPAICPRHPIRKRSSHPVLQRPENRPSSGGAGVGLPATLIQ
jgi:hypothetical protein